MTQATAERRSIAIHNAKAYLNIAKVHTKEQSDPEDADAVKLYKDICEAMRMLGSIEYDLDKIAERPHAQKKKG